MIIPRVIYKHPLPPPLALQMLEVLEKLVLLVKVADSPDV